MNTIFDKWLLELEKELEIVSLDDIKEEARTNMFAFGVSEALLKDSSEQAMIDFLSSCADIYKQKSINLKMVFYSWFDEQAGQVRMSAVSRVFGKLPFGCKLNVSDLNKVANGIYTGDSSLYTKGVLDVWRVDI